MRGVVLEGVENVLADEGDQESTGLGAVQSRDILDTVQVLGSPWEMARL